MLSPEEPNVQRAVGHAAWRSNWSVEVHVVRRSQPYPLVRALAIEPGLVTEEPCVDGHDGAVLAEGGRSVKKWAASGRR